MIKRYADGDILAKAAADYFVSLVAKTEGLLSVALSGGSTPKKMHKLLIDRDVDWSKVHVFWGDERTVSPDHQDSNYRMACETLLDHINIPKDNIHRIPAEINPEVGAKQYEQTLHEFFGEDQPRFDLIFLGMGDDGHTASLFPHTKALEETDQWVIANHVPKLDTWRITLSASVINQAKHVLFLVSGAGKADTLREVVNGPYLPETYPSQLIEPTDGELIWMVDEAAAALI